MTIQAQFLNIKWEASNIKLMTISSLSYAFGIKTETKKGADGNDKIVAKGYKNDSITLTYNVMRSCGANPEQEHSKVCEIARSGQKGTFILGGKKFGPAKTMLLRVTPSNILYSPDGTIMSMDITLTFGEPDEEKENKTQKRKKVLKSKSVKQKATLLEQMKKEKGIK